MKKHTEKLHLLRTKLEQRTGLILIGLGAFLGLFILIFFYFQIVRVPGFPELLPASQTAIFVEFPNQLAETDPILKSLNDTFKLNWNTDIGEWAASKSAIALLKDDSIEATGKNTPDAASKNIPQKLLPILMIQVQSNDKALAFFKRYQNPVGIVKEYVVNGVRAYSAPNLNFAFLSGVAVITSSPQNLEKFMDANSGFSSTLGSDSDFRRIHENTANNYFVYIKPDSLSRESYSSIAKYVPEMPIILPLVHEFGIGADRMQTRFTGSSYAVLPKTLQPRPITAYRASLLPLLPDEFSVLLAGHDIESQLKDLDVLLANSSKSSFAASTKIAQAFAKSYLPKIDYEQTISPLLQGEFATTAKNGSILFITDLAEVPAANQLIDTLHTAFQKTAGQFSPMLKTVTLPDGESAEELVPNADKVQAYEEAIYDTKIRGFVMDNLSIFDCIQDGKWFISNDLLLLKKSLALTQAKGQSIRESNYYKNYLQPILKNPELLGISILPQGVFGFSKQMHGDSLETNFVFDLLQ